MNEMPTPGRFLVAADRGGTAEHDHFSLSDLSDPDPLGMPWTP
jgi:hypothetical protein